MLCAAYFSLRAVVESRCMRHVFIGNMAEKETRPGNIPEARFFFRGYSADSKVHCLPFRHKAKTTFLL